VKGIPIAQYCDEAGLGTAERLALFDDVCSAILPEVAVDDALLVRVIASGGGARLVPSGGLRG